MDIVVEQINAVRSAKEAKASVVVEKNYRYAVYHYSKKRSYYNYYNSKFSAYLEAVNPRYWRCRTVVLLVLDTPEQL